MQPYLLMLLASLVTLTGCSNSLYFGTYTRIGIDASEDGAGIGVKNAAMHVAPTKTDGSSFNILGYADIDVSYTKMILSERFAVGDAAICASYAEPNSQVASAVLSSGGEAQLAESGLEPPAQKTEEPDDTGPLIFGTQSGISLVDLSWNDATSRGISFGYKRATGIRMPVKDEEIGSAYASIGVNSTADVESEIAKKSNTGGIRSIHTFATGDAAIIVAAKQAGKLTKDDTFQGCLPPAESDGEE